MNAKLLKTCLSATPFSPFTLHLANGHTSIHIARPMEVSFSEDNDDVVMVDRDGHRVIVSLKHVVAIEFDERGSRKFGFGS